MKCMGLERNYAKECYNSIIKWAYKVGLVFLGCDVVIISISATLSAVSSQCLRTNSYSKVGYRWRRGCRGSGIGDRPRARCKPKIALNNFYTSSMQQAFSVS
jgi:hypothetical protein